MTLFEQIRKLAALRITRTVAVILLAMCTVTWVGQSVSAVHDGDLAAALALADGTSDPDGSDSIDCLDEVDCDAIPLVAMDETHDVKLFFLREFAHWFPPASVRMPRNRDHAVILRMVSETFRPPDLSIG